MGQDLVVTKTPRVRQRKTSEAQTFSHYEHHTWFDNRPPTDVLVEQGVLQASETVMHDVITIPYWEIIRRGGIVNEPMSKVEYVYSAAPCSFVDVYNTLPYAQWSDSVLHTGHLWQVQRPEVFPSITDPEGLARAHDKAIARVFEKASAPSFNTLINLYQLPQLVGMLKTAYRRLKTLAWILRDRHTGWKIRALGHYGLVALKDLDGLWLEWRFGWRPFLMDLLDLINAFFESLKKPPPRITYRATERFSFEQAKENTSTYNPIGAPTGLKNSFSTSVTASFTFRAGIMLDGARITNKRRFGLRKEDLPGAVWDAVPFSFVLDWFIGVTTWLTGLALDRESVLASWCTTTAERRTAMVAVFSAGTISSGSGYDAKTYARSLGVSTSSAEVHLKSREVNLVPPSYPILDPRWSELTNFLHLLDALSLLLQQFKQLKSRR